MGHRECRRVPLDFDWRLRAAGYSVALQGPGDYFPRYFEATGSSA